MEGEGLAAGGFSAWLEGMTAALRDEQASEVPCDGCTACCSSSQFVHVGPDEIETLSRIPPALLFPAPRMPAGHMVLGYDEDGCCPMLTDDGCSIYEHRPRTCRTYDCRLFAATGLVPDDDGGRITQRVRRWRFDFASELDRNGYEALRAAAARTEAHGAVGDGRGPTSSVHAAVLAVEAHRPLLHGAAGTGAEP